MCGSPTAPRPRNGLCSRFSLDLIPRFILWAFDTRIDHLHLQLPQLKCCQGCLATPTGPMLCSFPSLSENEFRDGCQALQRRCQGRLDDTNWLDIRWQQDVLTIKKLYHSGFSQDLQTDAKTHHPEDLTSRLEDVDSEDEVLIWPMCFTRR